MKTATLQHRNVMKNALRVASLRVAPIPAAWCVNYLLSFSPMSDARIISSSPSTNLLHPKSMLTENER